MGKQHSVRLLSIDEQARTRDCELTIQQVKAKQDSGEKFFSGGRT